MKYLIILLLFSCQTVSVHEANLIEQNKTMLKQDEQSRKKQQKIRDSRKKTLFRTNINKKSKRYIS